MGDETGENGIEQVSEVEGVEIGNGVEEGTPSLLQLPFHLLLLSDLDPQAKAIPDWEGSAHALLVDKNSFAGFMQELAPCLGIEVPNLIDEGQPELELELRFAQLADFHPEQLADQIPAIAGLVQVRTLVHQLQQGDIAADQFKERLTSSGVAGSWADRIALSLQKAPETPPATEETSAGDRIDSLLDLVDLGGKQDTPEASVPAEREGGSPLVDLLLTAVDSGLSTAQMPLPRDLAKQLIEELDQLLSRQLSVLLHHPQVQALEAAWRGLKFLVDRLDFRRNIRLSVLPLSQDQLGPGLYHQVLMASFSGTVQELLDAPYSAIIADFEFDNNGSDLEQLRDLAETVSRLQILLIAGVGPGFFDRQVAAELTKLPLLNQHMKEDRYINWNGLRDNPESNFLALVLPRFLLRFPYGPDNRVRRFDFLEVVDGQPAASDAAGLLWANGALAVGVNMARSFAETGWATRMAGVKDGGRLADLPLWRCPGPGGEARVPLEVILPQSKQGEFYEAGFAVLGCRPNQDLAHLTFAPTVYKPGVYEDDEMSAAARLQSTLPCQIFFTHLTNYLLRFKNEIAGALDVEQVVRELTSRLEAVLKIGNGELPAGAVQVEAKIDQERPSFYRVEVHLKVPVHVLGQEIGLGMELELAR